MDSYLIEDDIVDDLVKQLNESLKKYDYGYGESLHEKIINKFNDIAEAEYRKYLGKFR